MNRIIIEVEDEWMNIRLKNAEKTQNLIAEGFGRLRKSISKKTPETPQEVFNLTRKRNSYDKSTKWYNGQKVPMIYICTTLWHEEDFEMATLIRSGK